MLVYRSDQGPLVDECRSLGMDSDVIQKYISYYNMKMDAIKLGGRNGYRDSDKTKVYKSEWAMQKQVKIRKFKNIEEAAKRAHQIVKSKLWSDLEGRDTIYLEDNRRMGRATAGRAFAGGKIQLASTGMDEYTLIHELTHQLPNCMHHSVQFRINLLKLTSRFIGTEAAKILKAEFKERKLKLSHSKPKSPESWYKSYVHMENVRNVNA